MQGLRSSQLARIGMVYLEEAVLDLLFEATQKGEGRTPSSISKSLGIPRSEEARNYPIVFGILLKLKEVDEYAERCPSSTRWQLTEKGLENRKNVR